MLDDSDYSDEDNSLNVHPDPQIGLGFRPYFQKDQEIRMKVDLPTFNGRMDVEKFLDLDQECRKKKLTMAIQLNTKNFD